MTDLKNKLANRRAEVEGTEPAPETIDQMLRQPARMVKLAEALPNGWDTERFIRIALTTIGNSPALQSCTANSVIGGVLLAAQLGLEIGGPLGHSYLTPFKGKAQLVIGYKGYVKLARQSGEILSIEARSVHRNDEFHVEYGLNPVLKHVPNLTEDRGEAYLWYGVAHYTNGGYYFVVMNRSEIEEHRARSNSPNSPAWRDDFQAMARKTTIRVMVPFLPLSTTAAKAFAQDETVHSTIVADLMDEPPDFIDVEEVIEDEPEETTAPKEAPVPADVCGTCGVSDGHEDECPEAPM